MFFKAFNLNLLLITGKTEIWREVSKVFDKEIAPEWKPVARAQVQVQYRIVDDFRLAAEPELEVG